MKISIVVPVYCCADCIPVLCESIKSVVSQITTDYEIILIDDRSPDNAWNIIQKLPLHSDDKIIGIRLTRNFGQHAAITAGLAESEGDYVIIMDCDLQDPPEGILQLYQKAMEGNDIVLGRRISRNHSRFRKISAFLYFKLLNFLSDNRQNGEFGTFSLLSRKAVNAYLKFKEKDRHYLFIVNWLGYQVGVVDYQHQDRYHGKSAYNFKNLFTHAISGLVFQTAKVLNWIIYLGFILSFVGFIFAVYLIYKYYIYSAYTGWTSLAVLILMLSGAIIASIGIVGLYIGKIFENSKERPLFIIDQKIAMKKVSSEVNIRK